MGILRLPSLTTLNPMHGLLHTAATSRGHLKSWRPHVTVGEGISMGWWMLVVADISMVSSCLYSLENLPAVDPSKSSAVVKPVAVGAALCFPAFWEGQ